jgi:RNA polymerase sigma-70 factor, ECF subfamily
MELREFEQAIELHRRAILAYAYTCSRDMHLAQDIVQETCVIALNKRDKYWPEANFGAWLISIARHVWLRECEKRQIRQKAMEYLHENAATLFAPEHYTEEHWQAEKQALKQCIQKLPELDRTIIEEHFVRHLKYEEIAAKISKSLSVVKVRMFRLREALRECVNSVVKAQETSVS